jgi:hypothetical protein
MKKQILLGLIISAASATAIAQPTLTAATNNPVAGDVFYGFSVDTAGVGKGAAGASITWDFSSVVRSDSDTTSYFTCASTPYCDSFAGANIVMYDGSDYAYGISSATGLELIGAYASGNYMHLSDHSTMFKFPMTYGTTFTDTFAAQFDIFGFTMFISGVNTFTCDAWGTITTPFGTFNNALRVRQVSVNKDSIDFMGSPEVNVSETESYSWYVAGFHSPLMTINYDTSGSGTPYVIDAKYYRGLITSAVKDVVAKPTTLNVYPNPATDNITFGFDINGASTATNLIVYDATGRVVNTINGTNLKAGKNEVSLNVSNLPAGMYIVRLQGEGAAASARFSVVK